jgi:hypothetical protein
MAKRDSQGTSDLLVLNILASNGQRVRAILRYA